MKTSKCRNCDGTGNVHVDIPAACSRVFDIPCWICGAANFKGMTQVQIKWYLKMYKAVEVLKTKSIRAGKMVSPSVWLSLKNAINMACGRLGISLETIPIQKAVRYGETHESVNMVVEFKEYERRLEAIPGTVAKAQL